LIRGELAVPDLPVAWNDLYREYLGREPTDPVEGVLQDIHWSSGIVGGFPCYLMGNLYAAGMADAIERDVAPAETLIHSNRMATILDWLRTRVHSFGRIYPPGELFRRATGNQISVRPFLNRLERRYLGG
jgi:carboxypeptidase Taq